MALLVCWVDCWIVGASLGEVLLDCWCFAGGSPGWLVPRWGKFINYSCWFDGWFLGALIDGVAGLLGAILFLWFCGRTLGSRVRLAISFPYFHSQQGGRTLGSRVRLAISSPYLHAVHFAVGHSGVGCA